MPSEFYQPIIAKTFGTVTHAMFPMPPLTSSKRSTKTVYAINSLSAARGSPAQLAAALRGHWAIEDRLH